MISKIKWIISTVFQLIVLTYLIYSYMHIGPEDDLFSNKSIMVNSIRLAVGFGWLLVVTSAVITVMNISKGDHNDQKQV